MTDPFYSPESDELFSRHGVPSLALRRSTSDPSVVTVVAVVLVRVLDEFEAIVGGIELAFGQDDYVAEGYGCILSAFQRRIVYLVAQSGFSVVLSEEGLVGSLPQAWFPVVR